MRKTNKQKQINDKQKDLDVPLVKPKEQPTSLSAIWNIKCLCQHEHFSVCSPELLSIMCRHDSKSTQIFISI